MLWLKYLLMKNIRIQEEALGGRDFNPELKESIQICDAGSAVRAEALQTAKRVLSIRAKQFMVQIAGGVSR